MGDSTTTVSAPEPYITMGVALIPLLTVLIGGLTVWRPEPSNTLILPSLNLAGSVAYMIYVAAYLIAPTPEERATVCAVYPPIAAFYLLAETALFASRLMIFHAVDPKKKRRVRTVLAIFTVGYTGGTASTIHIGGVAVAGSPICDLVGDPPRWSILFVLILLVGSLVKAVFSTSRIAGRARKPPRPSAATAPST